MAVSRTDAPPRSVLELIVKSNSSSLTWRIYGLRMAVEAQREKALGIEHLRDVPSRGCVALHEEPFPALAAVLIEWRAGRGSAARGACGDGGVSAGLGLLLLRDAAIRSCRKVVSVDDSRSPLPAGRRSMCSSGPTFNTTDTTNCSRRVEPHKLQQKNEDADGKGSILRISDRRVSATQSMTIDHDDGNARRGSSGAANSSLLLHRSATSHKLGMIVSGLPGDSTNVGLRQQKQQDGKERDLSRIDRATWAREIDGRRLNETLLLLSNFQRNLRSQKRQGLVPE